jgi:hypothetical protein
MHRIADARVLLANERPHASACEPGSQEEPARPAPYDEDVYRLLHENASIIKGV